MGHMMQGAPDEALAYQQMLAGLSGQQQFASGYPIDEH